MHYKTIVLELLHDYPKLHRELRRERLLLTTVETYAMELKASHEAWKVRLNRAHRARDQALITSEALEIAMKELERSLHLRDSMDELGPLPVEEVMAFIRARTRRA